MKVLIAIIVAVIFSGLIVRGADGAIRFHLSIPGSPIVYDERLDEYQIEYYGEFQGQKTKITIPLRYCPITGVELSSRREDIFEVPDREEMHDIFLKVREAKNIQEVEEVLGKTPDYVFSSERDHVQYSFVFETFVLAVFENEHDEFDFRFFRVEHPDDE